MTESAERLEPTANAMVEVASARGPGTGAATVAVRPAQFGQLSERDERSAAAENIDLILDVPLRINVELGRTTMSIGEVLTLVPGSVIELDRVAGEPVDVVINERLIAKGEVVVVDDNFGVRLTDIVSPAKRAVSLG